jgi:WD40 repeat protein
MSSFVRSSKFRNVVVTPFKRENTYENIQVSDGSAVSTGYGNCVDASTGFLAYIDKSSSGSCIGVLPHSSVGRRHVPVHAKTYKQPLIRANSSQVTTIQFTPHNEAKEILASGNMDGILSLFQIPEDGLAEDMTTPTRKISLKGSASTITSLQWHRAAANVIATAGNKEVHLWDIEKGDVICSNDSEHTTTITSLTWDWSGKRVLTSAKDNIVRLFDLRASGKDQVIGSARGLKRMSISWAGKSNDVFLAVGHSARMERQCVLYDSRNLSSALKTIRIDTNTSPMKTLYDFDCNILYCCSRGDTSIKVFEHDHNKEPYLHPINSNSISGAQTKDVCLMPKLAVDAKGCEIDRILRLTPNSIDPVRVEVPRKDKNRNFQEDLFPDTFARKAAVTSEEYFKGTGDALPLTVSVQKNSVTGSSGSTLRNRPGSLELKQKKAATTVAASEETVSSPMSAKANRANSLFAGQSKYKYVRMSCPNQDHTYFNLNIDTSVVDSLLISGSSRRFALPWKRLAGGSIYLGDLKKTGKETRKEPFVLTGLKDRVSSLQFNPSNDNVLASGIEMGDIVLWNLPSSSVALEESIDASGGNSDQCTILSGHMKGVRAIQWNPTVSNLFASSSTDNTVRFWDVAEQKEVCEAIEVDYDTKITSIGWNYDGTKLMAATMGEVLMADIRASNKGGKHNNILSKKPHAGGKGMKCQLLRDENYFCTIGFARMAARELKVWDIRKTDNAITTEKIDNGSGVLQPLYDFDTSCLFLAANGEATIHVYDMRNGGKASLCAPCTVPGDPMTGLTLLPKTSCDVKGVEYNRMLRCTKTAVQPLSFQVPRSNDMVEYFQDDIFQPTRSYKTESMMDIKKYLNGDKVTVKTIDLCPAGMKPVSKKPVVVRKSVNQTQKYFDEEKAKADLKKVKDASFERLQKLAVQHANYNVNQSMGKRRSVQQKGVRIKGEFMAEVNEDESSDSGWSDSDED